MTKRKGKANKINRASNKRTSSAKGKRQRKPVLQMVALLGVTLILSLFVIKPYFHNKQKNQDYNSAGIAFKKEGELSFYSGQNKKLISRIDIEIAENDFERAQGLMHRYEMDTNQGMLFIMENEEPQSFWMKNTYISLDILFLNKDREIVKIHKYTQPLSAQSLPSINKAKYIVEVIGGYCDKFNIIEGDFVKYNRLITQD